MKVKILVGIGVVVIAVGCATPGNVVRAKPQWKPTIEGMNLSDISPEQLGSERHFRYHFQLLLIKNMYARAEKSDCNAELLDYLNQVQKRIEVQRDGDVELLTQIRRSFKENDRLFFYEDKRGSKNEYGYVILGQDGKERRRWVLVD